jgi:hypothetical protein
MHAGDTAAPVFEDDVNIGMRQCLLQERLAAAQVPGNAPEMLYPRFEIGFEIGGRSPARMTKAPFGWRRPQYTTRAPYLGIVDLLRGRRAGRGR